MFECSLCSGECTSLNIAYCEISLKFSSKQSSPVNKSAGLNSVPSSGETQLKPIFLILLKLLGDTLPYTSNVGIWNLMGLSYSLLINYKVTYSALTEGHNDWKAQMGRGNGDCRKPPNIFHKRGRQKYVVRKALALWEAFHLCIETEMHSSI